MYTIEESGNGLSLHEVDAFEGRLGCRLPEAYQRFLTQHNGGRPSPDIIDIPGFQGHSTDIQELFGLGGSMHTSDIEWNLQTLRSRIDERLLPIGCDSGDNIFAISLRGEHDGGIVYCNFVESQVSYYLVAPDFDEFLKRLRPFA